MPEALLGLLTGVLEKLFDSSWKSICLILTGIGLLFLGLDICVSSSTSLSNLATVNVLRPFFRREVPFAGSNG